ncbi:hypothetical protein Tco_0077407 [Tanacetum coccineum]
MKDHGRKMEYGNPVKHYCKPFNYKSGCLEWPTYSWKDDGYCNGGNLLGAYIIGNTLRYQDLEWYEALKDGKLKEEALKSKAIMDGMIDEDYESSNEGWKRWDDFQITNDNNKESENEMEHEEEERCEVDDEEYVAIKENEYNDLTNASKEAIHAYQEIFRPRYKIDDVGEVCTIWKSRSVGVLKSQEVIMEYLVKISKKARIMELKRRHLKITVLTTNMPYPSRKIRRICACTSQRPRRKQDPIRRLRKKYRLNLKNDMPPRDN